MAGEILTGSTNSNWVMPTAGKGLDVVASNIIHQYALSSDTNSKLVKGWVKFNSSGVVLSGYNVTSVSRKTTGNFTINWTNNFPDANYCIQVSSKSENSSIIQNVTVQSATSCSVSFTGGLVTIVGISVLSGAAIDPTFGYVLAISN